LHRWDRNGYERTRSQLGLELPVAIHDGSLGLTGVTLNIRVTHRACDSLPNLFHQIVPRLRIEGGIPGPRRTIPGRVLVRTGLGTPYRLAAVLSVVTLPGTTLPV